MVTCQFSLYLLRTEQISEILTASLKEVQACGVSYVVGRMSTELCGSEEQVFAALKAAYKRAAEFGDVVLVTTVSNACQVPAIMSEQRQKAISLEEEFIA